MRGRYCFWFLWYPFCLYSLFKKFCFYLVVTVCLAKTNNLISSFPGTQQWPCDMGEEDCPEFPGTLCFPDRDVASFFVFFSSSSTELCCPFLILAAEREHNLSAHNMYPWHTDYLYFYFIEIILLLIFPLIHFYLTIFWSYI